MGRALLPFSLLLVLLAATGCRREVPLTVFAAASVTDVMEEAAAAWERETGGRLRLTFGSTSSLARNLKHGARADLFIAAHPVWIDHLEGWGRLIRGSRTALFGNRLALIGTLGEVKLLSLREGAGLAVTGRLAVADPDHVPAGVYAKQALMWLGAWDEFRDRLAVAGNVRGAVAFVQRGECRYGIAYATDACRDEGVVLIDLFPPAAHDPILYEAGIVAGGREEAAAGLLRFLRSGVARRVFSRSGFVITADGAR